MKNTLILTMALAATLSGSGAEILGLTLNPQDNAYYHAGEFQLDLFGGYVTKDAQFPETQKHSHARKGGGKSSSHDGLASGGLGLSYFPTLNFGLGVEASASEETVLAVDNVGYSLIARVPIKQAAIYFIAGASHMTDSWGELRPHAGGGVIYRLNRNWGVFGEGRGVSNADGQWGSTARGGVQLSW